MPVTADNIAELRRMIAEPTNATYSDAQLEELLNRYPVRDALGEPALASDGGIPPTLSERDVWIQAYDLHAVAEKIWQEKAAAVAGCFDVSADGTSLNRSQIAASYMQQARYHGARRRGRGIPPVVSPTVNKDNVIMNRLLSDERTVE